MDLSYCCADLERLAHPIEPGLGLITVIRSRIGPRFYLMYQKDWNIPAAEAGIQIKFCPYCVTELASLIRN